MSWAAGSLPWSCGRSAHKCQAFGKAGRSTSSSHQEFQRVDSNAAGNSKLSVVRYVPADHPKNGPKRGGSIQRSPTKLFSQPSGWSWIGSNAEWRVRALPCNRMQPHMPMDNNSTLVQVQGCFFHHRVCSWLTCGPYRSAGGSRRDDFRERKC